VNSGNTELARTSYYYALFLFSGIILGECKYYFFGMELLKKY